MKSSLIAMLGLLAAWVIPCAAGAAALPYTSQPWGEFPDREWSLEELDPLDAYPDWNPTVFKFESYQETEPNPGVCYGMATGRAYNALYIAVAYYSKDGQVYLAQEPLQLVSGQRITVTWRLPAQDAGVSRLLLLKRQPSSTDWAALLAHPVKPVGPVRELVAEQWLGRQPAQAARLPWDASLRPLMDPPSGFAFNSWPACRAWLEQDMSLASKDCWVDTTCQAVFTLDDFGPASCWQLDWSSEFSFGCQLADSRASTAVLLLAGRPKADFTGASSPQIQVSFNGWQPSSAIEQKMSVNGLQQYLIDVSHYMKPGWNTASLRLSTSGGGMLELASVELWVR